MTCVTRMETPRQAKSMFHVCVVHNITKKQTEPTGTLGDRTAPGRVEATDGWGLTSSSRRNQRRKKQYTVLVKNDYIRVGASFEVRIARSSR